MKKKTFLLYIFLICSLLGYSQEGNYYITNFPPSTYQASPQNWSIVQDSLRRIYVANNSGVLMYDGEYWTNTLLKDDKRAFSLAKSTDSKTIYVGGESAEFGMLSFSAKGKVKYLSLSDSLPKKEKDFGNVWSIQVVEKNVFFCANERICWFKNNRYYKSFTPTGEKFHTFFTIENTLLVREAGKGLMYLQNNALKPVPGTEEFAGIKLRAVIARKSHMYWLCTDKGLYILSFDTKHPDWTICTKFNSPVDKWMMDNEIYCGLKLNGNTYALGSIDKGVLLVDSTFHPVNHINYETNLLDETVNFIYKDLAGNLWFALNNGLSYVESNTPLTHWTKSNGLAGSISSIAKYNNTLYISTDKGIEKLDEEHNTFVNIGISDESWALYNYKNALLAGTHTGVYSIEGDKINKVLDNDDVILQIKADNRNNDILYLAGNTKVQKGIIENGTFKPIKKYNVDQAASIVQDKAGDLYFGSSGEGAVYTLGVNNPDSLYVFNFPDTATRETSVFTYNDNVLVTTDEGIYTAQGSPKTSFIKDKLYNVFKGQMLIIKGIQFEQDIWIAATYINAEDNTKTDEVSVLKYTPNGFKQDYKMLKHIRGLTTSCFMVDSGKVFIGTNEGLIEYNTAVLTNNNSFNTFIALITHKSDNDTVFQNVSNSNIAAPEFTYSGNQICFYGAASDFYDKSELQFSYYLEGLNSEYCHWTRNNKMPYPNLPEGHYTFHLKSRDIFGIEGTPITFSFTILPPWYRTIWAYAGYVILLVGFVVFVVRYNIKRLKEQNIRLENIITERTKTIAVQKAEIEEKNKDITNSINYAKLIQEAILPPKSEIKKTWKNFFLFFQPKDIVSGDFYWFNKVNDDEILVGCADCTGHGVPGGFMSMICSDKLSDAAKKTSAPDEILFQVNNAVKLTLRQNNEELVNKDGMEIALVKVDLKHKKVLYAGANRALWIYKKASGELVETKPTKSGIASYTPMDSKFDLHEFQLEAGDVVYLSSDGFADQFGGPEGKKFMSRNFKNFLVEIALKPIEEQGQLVGERINNWMKGYDQVDDLLVIGIQV